jgi:hypothetical protein
MSRQSFNVVIPGRAEGASPESIARVLTVPIPTAGMDSGLASVARASQ